MRPIILAIMLLALSCAPAMATDDTDETESSRVYDAEGRYQGRTVERDGTTRIYDAQGRYQGRVSEKSSGDAMIYDAQGKFQGRIKK
ncbi:hypothetical protein [Desulfolutivibrio sulfoxidireducens]|uniref:hypothetical protein n=1 Tax=Desulfolutivibrio sulfoxidireducens TaxID=2773299 RepID=UPI00159D2B3C|nr:hypothetical protein [Desulfolutivibrio sulfoxidireducens]QLA14772.1 hypothetical protein GD605_00745 [Desulfolutivibrio sulfoxidireducens]QLA18345.1 hypothetical protein GD604_00695 [Desulfolutivibrio sulfoxidireducens]